MEITKLTVPVEVEGVIQNVTYDIKDAGARQLIADLGNALYWVGVTTTTLTDGNTTNPITVNGENVTAKIGAIAQYNGEEFAWNGTAWQSLGKNNFGSLAFKNKVSATYTPQGTVNVTQGQSTTKGIRGMSSVGTLPTFSYNSANEALVFNAGKLPTMAENVNAVTAVANVTVSFKGTQATIESN